MAQRHNKRRAKRTVPASMNDMRRARERKVNRRYYKAAAVFFSVLIFVIAVAAVFSSGIFYRSVTAVKVDGQAFSLAEFNYYYYNYYYRYRDLASNYSKDGGVSLPASGVSFDKQYSDDSTRETWKDYFERATLDELARYVQVNAEAQKRDFVLEGEDLIEYEAALADYEAQAENGGLAVNDYLRTAYGKGVNYDVLSKCLKFIYTADAFVESYRDTLEITEEELEDYYTAGKEYYCTYNYMYFLVKAELPDRKAYETDEEYERAANDALDAAKATADGIVSRVQTDKDMEDEAKSYDSEQYGDPRNVYRSYEGLLLGGTYGDWLMSPERSNGDMYVAGISTGYYVLRFLSVQENDFPTADVRMIRVTAESVDENDYADDESDDLYEAALRSADEDARKRAEELYSDWIAAGGGEDLFAEYASKHSDRISHTSDDDGLFLEMCPGEFASSIDEWCFDILREGGDCEIIHSESEHAYYIIYYSGPGRPYSLVLAENDMKDSMFNSWYSNIGENAEIKTTVFYSMTMKHIPKI